MTSVGEALAEQLKQRGVDTVFGIPGVHTVELYRGLAASGIRHVTPRHEQGAGFMADGYARVSGKPGIALVITGPGLTNTLTPMAQARADSVPVLVLSGVNRTATLGKGMGHLHELPDQHGLAAGVALVSEHVAAPDQLAMALDRAFAPFVEGRPGPTHIQIPLDVAAAAYKGGMSATPLQPPVADQANIAAAAEAMANANRPVILAGGGARWAGVELKRLAERLDAPVVQTVNARGVIFDHALSVPASPSLQAVRRLIEESDIVLAVGTELGPTDYDMYDTGTMPRMNGCIRVDICPDQLARHDADIPLPGEARQTLSAILACLPDTTRGADGPARADRARQAALEEIGPEYRAQVEVLNALRDAVPGCLLVGDSTQPIYAGNLYYDHDRAGGWFNAATGYGALGYGIPAAIGASVADPAAPVICIAGDGGAQFSLPEIMTAVDEKLPVTFLVWNNRGYREIAASMQAADVEVIGCDPSPPDFVNLAASFGIPFRNCAPNPDAVIESVLQARERPGPHLIEVEAPPFSPEQR
ncbi:5-guanidino-2-oxopentanoate decarboxylase [Nitratireductor sp. XY-223]|uniref:5-guanidino-2-oxopentanoate decarboxylase n=1 Tax=Nitratireductor sp. XY-223 TaxID=2561926 RepID=UPI0010AA9291|nr:5-guanidino-2-oxopentanoate decarboxylase [Nitratireductor sp. XY-223]